MYDLNFKVHGLSKIINGLKQDIDYIFTIISELSINRQQDALNKTDLVETSTNEMFKLLYDSVADVKDLKTELEQLIKYARKGFASEKALSQARSRDTMNIYHGHGESISRMTREISEMKIWQKNYKDQLDEIKTETQNYKDQLDKIKSETQNYKDQFDEIKTEIQKNKDHLDEIKTETQDYKDQLDEIKIETQDYKDQLDVIKAETHGHGESISRMTREISGMKTGQQKYKDQLDEIKTETQDNKDQLDEIKTETQQCYNKLTSVERVADRNNNRKPPRRLS